MPNYHIDVWQDESIWSWAGKVDNEDEAFEAARQQLNEDWDQEYETWEDLAADMDGTALLYDTKQDRIEKLEALLGDARDHLQHFIGSSYCETDKDDEALLARIDATLNSGD